MPAKSGYLTKLGVYGFATVEPVILAALITEDPLLLIGNCGTGKTYLLNSISEDLGLEHRHYNASMVSFDDLVGFPYPSDEMSSVKFLETPATIWRAESVLFSMICFAPLALLAKDGFKESSSKDFGTGGRP